MTSPHGLFDKRAEHNHAQIEYWIGHYTTRLANEVMSERDMKWCEERLATMVAARMGAVADEVSA
jgi:hypothetical protein